jgi:hypothetical protein
VCTAEVTADGYVVTCPGSAPITIARQSSTALGNCVLRDTDSTLTVNCGSNDFRLTLCGSGTTGWLSGKRQTFNEATHFCSNEWVDLKNGGDYDAASNAQCVASTGVGCNEEIVVRCGADGGEAYDITTKYCARSLIMEATRVVNGKRITATLGGTAEADDDLSLAAFWDVDEESPFTANWKVLDKGKCFVAGGSIKTCSGATDDAYNASVPPVILRKAVGSASSATEFKTVALNVPSCGTGMFYNRTQSQCTPADISVAPTKSEAKQCGSIMAGDNTCYTAETPSSASGAILAKACWPLLSGSSPSQTERKTWYDAATVASCSETRRDLILALTCNSASSRQVSSWQVRTALSNDLSFPDLTSQDQFKDGKTLLANFSSASDFPGFNGSAYTKKVSCYAASAANDCHTQFAGLGISSASVSYISGTASTQLGSCVLTTTASSRACPGPTSGTANRYTVRTKAQYADICKNWLANVASTTEISSASGVTVKD